MPKKIRRVTYRRWKYPCIMLEGHWLTKMYGLEIGDTVEVVFGKKNIIIKTGGQRG